jgi:hypothetical protein
LKIYKHNILIISKMYSKVYFLSKFIQMVCSKFLKFIFKRIKNIHNLNKKNQNNPNTLFLSAQSTSSPTFLLACGSPHHQGRRNQPRPAHPMHAPFESSAFNTWKQAAKKGVFSTWKRPSLNPPPLSSSWSLHRPTL